MIAIIATINLIFNKQFLAPFFRKCGAVNPVPSSYRRQLPWPSNLALAGKLCDLSRRSPPTCQPCLGEPRRMSPPQWTSLTRKACSVAHSKIPWVYSKRTMSLQGKLLALSYLSGTGKASVLPAKGRSWGSGTQCESDRNRFPLTLRTAQVPCLKNASKNSSSLVCDGTNKNKATRGFFARRQAWRRRQRASGCGSAGNRTKSDWGPRSPMSHPQVSQKSFATHEPLKPWTCASGSLKNVTGLTILHLPARLENCRVWLSGVLKVGPRVWFN